MATYTTDKIEFGGNVYKLQDSDALPLAGGNVTGPVNFGDSVTMEDASIGDIVITGNASSTNNLQVNTINGEEVGSTPKFTDTVTTVTTSGSGNAITAISASNGAITATKGTTFLTSHQDISGKADKSATVSTVAWDSTNKKLTKTINGTTSDVVTAATLRTGLNVADGAEVNQNAFSNIKVGSTTIVADGKTDTLELTAGSNITLTPDATNDKVTIAATDTTYESKAAASGGTDVSLVTTGEKYTWNNKTSNTGTVTKVTAGAGLSGGDITTTGTIAHSNSVTAQTTQAIYPIKIDAQGHISGYGTAVTPLTSHQTIKQDGVTGATVNRFGACSTAAATAAKTVSITTGTFTLETGAKVTVKFTNKNTANSPTLNVNSTGAKNIYHNGAQITSGTNKEMLYGTVEFVYDGTQWQLIGNYVDTNTAQNQNAFSNVKVGSTTITADTTTDTIELIAGDNITLTPDATNDKVTIAATDTTYTPASANPLMDGTAAVGTSVKYAREDHVHPTDTSRAPTNHASTATTYGIGTSSNYGHVKLSDAIDSTSSTSSGITATPNAVRLALGSAKHYTDVMVTSGGNITNHHFIVLGDSYGTGNQWQTGVTTSPTWIGYVKTYLSIPDGQWHIKALDGCGFIAGHTFLQSLKDVEATLDDPSEITDIVIGGGYNDHGQSVADIVSAIEAFNTYARSHFINAHISLACFGWDWATNRYEIGGSSWVGYRQCSKYGWSYLNGCELIMHNYRLFAGDHFHPNQDGQEKLGYYVTEALLTGSCTVYYPFEEQIPVTANTSLFNAGTFYMISGLCEGKVLVGLRDGSVTTSSSSGITLTNGNPIILGTVAQPYTCAGSYFARYCSQLVGVWIRYKVNGAYRFANCLGSLGFTHSDGVMQVQFNPFSHGVRDNTTYNDDFPNVDILNWRNITWTVNPDVC